VLGQVVSGVDALHASQDETSRLVHGTLDNLVAMEKKVEELQSDQRSLKRKLRVIRTPELTDCASVEIANTPSKRECLPSKAVASATTAASLISSARTLTYSSAAKQVSKNKGLKGISVHKLLEAMRKEWKGKKSCAHNSEFKFVHVPRPLVTGNADTAKYNMTMQLLDASAKEVDIKVICDDNATYEAAHNASVAIEKSARVYVNKLRGVDEEDSRLQGMVIGLANAYAKVKKHSEAEAEETNSTQPQEQNAGTKSDNSGQESGQRQITGFFRDSNNH